MRAVVNQSKRKLTRTHLVVDWRGLGNLFYRMDRKQAEALFNGSSEVEVQEKLKIFRKPTLTSFVVNHFSGGKLSVGCEEFNREEVRELKRWAGVKG